MPTAWTAEVVPSVGVLHADLEAVDIESGQWFKCKFCPNRQISGGHFKCRKDCLFGAVCLGKDGEAGEVGEDGEECEREYAYHPITKLLSPALQEVCGALLVSPLNLQFTSL
jgi:hypothetical protein